MSRGTTRGIGSYWRDQVSARSRAGSASVAPMKTGEFDVEKGRAVGCIHGPAKTRSDRHDERATARVQAAREPARQGAAGAEAELLARRHLIHTPVVAPGPCTVQRGPSATTKPA